MKIQNFKPPLPPRCGSPPICKNKFNLERVFSLNLCKSPGHSGCRPGNLKEAADQLAVPLVIPYQKFLVSYAMIES